MKRNEAIEVIKRNYPHVTESGSQFETALRLLIPELAVSEDELIRKELLDYCKNRAYIYPNDPKYKNISAWIAWLEKQGEHANFINKIQIGDKVTRNEDGVLVNLSQLERVANPAEKVELKFKVGDWVVIDGEVLHIKEVTEDGYFTDEGGLIPFRNEKEVHIWTIQDAKDGDVLILNNEIFIYAHRKQMYSIAVAQCFVDSAGGFHLDGEFGYVEHGGTISPATKEQSDILMKAIADAGYTFDFEKKELKKIEQKPDEWNKNDEVLLDETLHFIKEFQQSDRCIDEGDMQNSVTCENWLKSLKERYTWKPSDEQMKILNEVLNFAANHENPHWNDYIFGTLHNLIIQLKKLKKE